MTLFEKIYFTCAVIFIVLFIISLMDEFVDFDVEWLACFFEIQLELTIGYEIVRLLLYIWGVRIDLFPSIFL